MVWGGGPSVMFRARDWPHGLRCSACGDPFAEGDEIADEALGFVSPQRLSIREPVCLRCGGVRRVLDRDTDDGLRDEQVDRRDAVSLVLVPLSGIGEDPVVGCALPGGHGGDCEPRVAALFVETGGAYFGLPDVDPWDEERDARLYAGPWPVVAHPPCQRWCMFAKGIEKVHGYKVGDDDGCFEAALNAVHRFGGVIEHPAWSLAWDAFDMPKPISSQGWTETMLDGGASCYVEQGRYGHPMRKATWLYAYGVDLPQLRWGRTNDNEMLGEFKWGSRLYKPEHDRNRPRVDGLHSVTPPAFSEVLLAMARSACVEAAA